MNAPSHIKCEQGETDKTVLLIIFAEGYLETFMCILAVINHDFLTLIYT